MSARIFRVALTSEYQNQRMINTFTYLSDLPAEPTAGAEALANALGFMDASGNMLGVPPEGTLWEALADIHLDDVEYKSVYIFSPYDTTGLIDELFPASTNGNDTSPDTSFPFEALSIRSSRTRRDVRRGFKRISGFSLDQVGGAGAVIGTLLTRLQDFALRAGTAYAGLVGGNSYTFTPMVEKLNPVVIDGKKKYVLFENETDAILASMVGVSYAAVPQVTSQVSRKWGKGI